MKKVKVEIIILALALTVSVFGCKERAPVNDFGAYTESVSLDLSFENGSAVCSLTVQGEDTAAAIRANMWLYRENDDESWELLQSWKNMTVDGNCLEIVEKYNVGSSGDRYKLYFTGKCFAENSIYYDALMVEEIVKH